MDLSTVKSIFIPEGVVQKIESGGVTIWHAASAANYTNQVPLSINADGTIYNGGLGYKDGYRVRSNGEETAVDFVTITGFIPVNGGDVVRISGCDFSRASNGNAVNAADSSFTNLGQLTSQPSFYGIFNDAYKSYGYPSIVEETAGVWMWIVPPVESGVEYIRITATYGTGVAPPGAGLIVTVNEEIA